MMGSDNAASDTPFLEAPDTLEITLVEYPFQFKGSNDNDLKASIVEAVNRMGGVGDNAEHQYQQAIEALRPRTNEVLRIIAAEYRALPEDRYLDRWSLIQLVSELANPEAIGFLDEILSSPIPPERSRDTHGFSTVAEEVMLRTTSVEAVARLSSVGLEAAREVLIKHVSHENFSVRRAAVQALLETAPELEQRLRQRLQKTGEERLLEIRRVDVRTVPQATGGLFLVHPETRGEVPPHDLRGRSEI